MAEEAKVIHHHHQPPLPEETKVIHHHHQPPPPAYGTFQGVANYPPQPVIGFPQPVPPPGSSGQHYYAHGYQAVPGYAVAEGRPLPRHSLPCCGLGLSWFLFILGFFLGTFPWYIGAIVFLCVRSYDHREKPGYIACTIAALLATVIILFGLSSQDDHHHHW